MLKFTTAAALVVIAISAFLAIFFVDAAAPKWHQLTPDYTYRQYLNDMGKKIPTDYKEYEKREKLFLASLREVLAHNSDKSQLYKKGINKFSDWTKEEFQRLNGGKATSMRKTVLDLQKEPFHSFHVKSSTNTYPIAHDWRNMRPSVVTAVKDQGMCGSCWAHGSTETLESHYAIATGNLLVLSQQEVTACAPNPNDCGGTGGCSGSVAQLAYSTIIKTGQTEEWQYPYTAYYGTTGTCDVPAKSTVVAKFSGYKTVASNDQDSVLDALVSVGPLAVNVDASQWNSYESGIYTGCNYAKNISIDHVVQMVGYGVDPALNNQKYWTIRNSWSGSWGEQGYIRLIRHDTAECGWNVNAQDGTACKGAPSTQWTCGQCGVLFDTSYPIASVPSQ